MKRKKLEAMVTGDRPEIADDIDALRARLKIDRDRLDEEVMEQPQLFHHMADPARKRKSPNAIPS